MPNNRRRGRRGGSRRKHNRRNRFRDDKSNKSTKSKRGKAYLGNDTANKNTTNNTENDTKIEEKKADDVVDDDTEYIVRINKLLELQEGHMNDDIYEMILSIYNKKDIKYFIYDYDKYLSNMDTNKFYLDNNNKCNIHECNACKREYRDRNEFDYDQKKRYKLYKQCSTEKNIALFQILDQLHIIKYHLCDLGLRANKNYKHMSDIVTQKRKIFNKITNNLYLNNSKFVTHIVDENEEEKQENIVASYGFGFRFYYHEYHKNNQTKCERIPGSAIANCLTDYGNVTIDSRYKYCDWYVSAKYHSMKEEVLNSEKEKLSLIQYKNTVNKAILKFNALKRNIEAQGDWLMVYGMIENANITLKHILSVLFYTNFTNLQNEFSKSFRKMDPKESDESLKQRHSKYANWGKLLRETVEVFGTYFSFSKTSSFYHGISCKMLFEGFFQRFCGPTSTSIIEEIAVMFAANGIVIKIENDKSSVPFFNCRSWSDFGAEAEMLFIGGFSALEVCGLTDVVEMLNYDKEIKAIKTFETGFIRASQSTDRATLQTKNIIQDLINSVIVKNSDTSLPQYMQALFSNLLKTTHSIRIDLGIINKDTFPVQDDSLRWYGYKILSDLYFNPDNSIKLKVIKKLFPALTSIQIQRIDKIQKNGNFTLTPSISVGDEFLLQTLSLLSSVTNTWESICIHNPINSDKSLRMWMDKYSVKYSECEYKMTTQLKNNPRGGLCRDFLIYGL